ncbi:LytR/AlgR family response regulator transcription factor [Thermophilibacter sp.]
MIHTLIVEDEAEEAERLISYVRRYGEAHNETFQVTWLRSAMDMLSEKARYDLVLLDINLPGINGMEAAQLMRLFDEVTPIVFVTNLAQYAVKGYEVGATGFIVKPVTWGNLSLNLDRVMRSIRQNAGRSVMVPTEDGLRVVPLSSIVYVEVTGHRLTYHLESDAQLETRGSLGQLEEELAGAPVVRVAKSCIANMDKVSLVRGQGLQMSNGEVLRISRSRKREVLDAVTDYLGGRR